MYCCILRLWMIDTNLPLLVFCTNWFSSCTTAGFFGLLLFSLTSLLGFELVGGEFDVLWLAVIYNKYCFNFVRSKSVIVPIYYFVIITFGTGFRVFFVFVVIIIDVLIFVFLAVWCFFDIYPRCLRRSRTD